MSTRKDTLTREDLQNIEEEICRELQIFHEKVTSLLKQINEDLIKLSENLDRFSEEIRFHIETDFRKLADAIASTKEQLDKTHLIS